MTASRYLPFAACGVLALVAGCAVGPDYRRPEVDAPPFKESGAWKPAEPGDQIPRGPWWKTYGDPVLDRLEAGVELSSATVQAAEAQYRAARAAAGIAEAGRLPAVNAEGAANRARSASRGSTGSVDNTFSAGLSATWELDLWGRVRRGIEAGRATAAASQADLEAMRLSIHALLAQAYFSLRVAESRRELYRRQVDDYARFLQITRNRYDQGVATRADVLAADTQLKTTQAQVLDSELQCAQQEHAIAVLLGRPPAGFTVEPGSLPERVPMPPAALPSQVLERRPDIAAAERRVAAANAQIGVAKGGYFPVLSLSGSAGYQSSSLTNLFSTPDRVWGLGAGAVMPLFDAGKVRSQVAQARALHDASVADYRQTVLTAFQEVEDNLAAAAFLADESALRAAAVASARQGATIVLNQYKAGTVSYLNVVTAQGTQFQAELDAVDLQGRRLTASLNLFKALGGADAPLAP